MNRGRVSSMLGVAWLALLPTWAGEKAQTSGAVRTEEVSAGRPPSEAERVGTMNKLLRNRQFDVLRSGNSLGGAIDVSLPIPSVSVPNIDPKAQQRLLEEYDRKKNWLAEPGAVKPREVNKADQMDSGKSAKEDDVPNFSRERGRSRRSRNDSGPKADFEDGSETTAKKPAKASKLDADDTRSEGRSEGRSERNSSEEWARRDGQSKDSARSRSISEILAPEADHRTWFSGNKTESSGGTFSFNSPGMRSGSAAEGFAGTTGPGTGSGFANPSANPSSNPLINPVAPPSGISGVDGDPGRRFDPTVAPSSPFSSPDAGFFGKSGASSSSASDGGFGAFGSGSAGGGAGRGLEGSVRSLFTAPSSDFGSQIRSTPSFTPRPAVLSFPQSGPF